MPDFHCELTLHAKSEAVWGVITDFERYPDIIRELKEAAVERRDETEALVRFVLELPVRRVTYRLRYEMTPRDRLAWTMVDSNTLTENRGEWALEAGSESTKISYNQHVGFPAWMAWAVTDAAFAKEMEKTLQRFREYIESRGG